MLTNKKIKKGVRLMSYKIIVRVMDESDIPEALKLWRISFNAGFSIGFDTEKSIERYLKRNPDLSSVAYTEDGQLVGALMCGHDGRRGSIYHTAVDSEYRGNSIGRRMEERSLSALKEIGITTGFLFISTKNPGSEEFWRTIGWTVIPTIKYLYKEF
ncbi:GNAT family N-acetyltransferase [Mycoplasmatota bacterium WC44]